MMDAPSTSSFSHCNSNDSLPTTEDTATLFIHSPNNLNTTRRKIKKKALACKRRNPRVLIHRKRTDVAAIGLPLGMSFAAVMAEICTSAIKESLANVFGDKLDGLSRNFEQSFISTLSTLRLIYESSTSNEGNNFSTMKMEVPTFKSALDKGDCSRDSIVEDCNSEAVLHEETQDQSNKCEEVGENFHMNYVSHSIALHRQLNQMVCFPPSSSGSVTDNTMINAVEKSVVVQSRSNDLKTLELALTMKKLKLSETQLALNSDMNQLGRSKLAMGMSKASFEVEKFKNQLENLRHGELNKKCIDCLIAGLLVMCSSLLYGAYVFSYERIAESTASCRPSTKESKSWWSPKSVISFDSRLHIFWCQVQVMSRMTFGVLMIFAIAYLLIQRSTTTSQTMPITFILLLLGLVCGYCGKLCVDTLGGSGSLWFLYWETLCMLHFLSMICTPILFQILHGPVTAPQKTKQNVIIPYWIRRFWFYATLLVFLPLFCGLTPFASLGQWKDHFLLKVFLHSTDSSE